MLALHSVLQIITYVSFQLYCDIAYNFLRERRYSTHHRKAEYINFLIEHFLQQFFCHFIFRLNEIIKNNVLKYLIMSFPLPPRKNRAHIFAEDRENKNCFEKRRSKKKIKLLNRVKIPTAKISLLQTWEEMFGRKATKSRKLKI